MNRLAFAAAAIVAVAAGLGASWYVFWPRDNDVFAACRKTHVVGGAATIGGPFTLVDHNGRTVTDADVLTVPSLIYFGFTFCPDVCPLDTARNADAVYVLDDRGIEVQPVFISVDPERDTPEQLAAFAETMHPRMLGLTGTAEQVRAAARAYRVFFQRQPGSADDPFYLIDHTTQSYFTLPGHGFVEFFRRDETPEEVADRMACFIAAAARN